MRQDLTSALSELRRRLERLYGDRLVTLILYGSQARGDPQPGSDTDVLVVLRGPVDSATEIERTLDIVADLSLAHNQVISCLFMDEQRFAGQAGPLLRNLHREGIPV